MYKVTLNGEEVEKFENENEANDTATRLRAENPNAQVQVEPCDESK
jgi:hypothetical protein